MSYGTVQAEKMTTESGYSLGAGNASSFKNRIINGNMATAQRSTGPVANAVSSSTLTYATLDRWGYWAQQASKFTVQQGVGSLSGFPLNALITSSTALSVASDSYYSFAQRIEGYNFADFNFGLASAKSFTVSFWIYSSITGTFPFYCFNSGYSRSYVSTFTVNAANTWEQKTITVAGDTAGSWVGATNGIGIEVGITLAAGSNWFAPSANTWSSTNFGLGLSGATNFLATNGATMYVTGFQLEAGTVATSFDFRSYGTELQLCYRYNYVYYRRGASSDSNVALPGTGSYYTASSVYTNIMFPVTMRTTPTLTTPNRTDAYCFPANSTSPFSPTVSLGHQFYNGCFLVANTTSSATGGDATNSFMATGNWVNGDYLGFSAEL
jgi:hypothetical protein